MAARPALGNPGHQLARSRHPPYRAPHVPHTLAFPPSRRSGPAPFRHSMTPQLKGIAYIVGLLLAALLAAAAVRQVERPRREAAEGALAQARTDLNAQSAVLAEAQRTLAELQTTQAAREEDLQKQLAEIQQREEAINAREQAANGRVEASFQGMMVQQRLFQTLEELKASLPDLTPEVEKLTREHAQLFAENERLKREVAAFRERAVPPTP